MIWTPPSTPGPNGAASAYKLCHACKTWLGAEEFTRDRSRPDGLNVWCRLCRRQLRKGWRSEILQRARRSFWAASWDHFELLAAEREERAAYTGRRRKRRRCQPSLFAEAPASAQQEDTNAL